MSKLIRSYQIIAFSIFFLLLSVFISGCENRHEDLNLSAYQYRDTKDLVKFVYDASLILKKDGLKGLEYFRETIATFMICPTISLYLRYERCKYLSRRHAPSRG